MNTELNISTQEDPITLKVTYAIYILYLISIFVPLLPIIAVIFAYIFQNDAKVILKSHYQFLIRSFWIGLLYFLIAALSLTIVIGVVLLPLAIVWWFIRIIKGFKSLLRNESILYPKTWLF